MPKLNLISPYVLIGVFWGSFKCEQITDVLCIWYMPVPKVPIHTNRTNDNMSVHINVLRVYLLFMVRMYEGTIRRIKPEFMTITKHSN